MTESDWDSLLDQDASNFQARLEYSDWLEENGCAPEAVFHRWLATRKVWPDYEQYDEGYEYAESWVWWSASSGRTVGPYLGRFLFDSLDGYRNTTNIPYLKEYPTRKDAERRLYLVWQRIQKT